MILPVKVDFPESTWPIKTRLAFSLWKFFKSVNLSIGQSLFAFNSAVVILGSSFRMITYSFGF